MGLAMFNPCSPCCTPAGPCFEYPSGLRPSCALLTLTNCSGWMAPIEGITFALSYNYGVPPTYAVHHWRGQQPTSGRVNFHTTGGPYGYFWMSYSDIVVSLIQRADSCYGISWVGTGEIGDFFIHNSLSFSGSGNNGNTTVPSPFSLTWLHRPFPSYVNSIYRDGFADCTLTAMPSNLACVDNLYVPIPKTLYATFTPSTSACYPVTTLLYQGGSTWVGNGFPLVYTNNVWLFNGTVIMDTIYNPLVMTHTFSAGFGPPGCTSMTITG